MADIQHDNGSAVKSRRLGRFLEMVSQRLRRSVVESDDAKAQTLKGCKMIQLCARQQLSSLNDFLEDDGSVCCRSPILLLF